MKIVKSDSNVQEMLLLFVIVVGAIFLIVTMVNYGNNKQNTMDTMVTPQQQSQPSQQSQKNPVLENSGSVEASTPDVMCGVSPAPVSGVQSPGANFTVQNPSELLPKPNETNSMMNPPSITSPNQPNMLAPSDVIGTSSTLKLFNTVR